jgi:RHS repeat-associated protein
MLLQDGTNTYVYGLGLISVTDSLGNRTYFLKDGLGNTVALCDGTGTINGTYTYDVYGALRSQTGTGTTEFTFTGEQNDPNGLEYLRARYYDNASGRFLSGDPLGSGYAYAGANPVNRVDPTGLYTLCGVDDVWGYICYDSTQVGLPLCSPDGTCEMYQGDGSGPGNVATVANGRLYCDDNVDACTTTNGDIYAMNHTICFQLIGGRGGIINCGSYLGHVLVDQFNVRPIAPIGFNYCIHGDLNCSGARGEPGCDLPCTNSFGLTPGERQFLSGATKFYCDSNPQASSCDGRLNDPGPTPPTVAGPRFAKPTDVGPITD